MRLISRPSHSSGSSSASDGNLGLDVELEPAALLASLLVGKLRYVKPITSNPTGPCTKKVNF